MAGGDSDSTIRGPASSLTMTPAPSALPSVAFTGPDSDTTTVSGGSTTRSSNTATSTVWPTRPGANVSVPAATAA